MTNGGHPPTDASAPTKQQPCDEQGEENLDSQSRSQENAASEDKNGGEE